jgi:hypothetical protein
VNYSVGKVTQELMRWVYQWEEPGTVSTSSPIWHPKHCFHCFVLLIALFVEWSLNMRMMIGKLLEIA